MTKKNSWTIGTIFLAVLLVSCLFLTARVNAAPTNGWDQNNTVYYKNGSMVKNKWVKFQKGQKSVVYTKFSKKWLTEKGTVYYYFNKKGKKITGTDVLGGKFFHFGSNGKFAKVKTTSLQKAAVYKKDFAALKKLIGKPKKSVYTSSCFGSGKDGILTYTNFKVYTYREGSKEVFMNAE